MLNKTWVLLGVLVGMIISVGCGQSPSTQVRNQPAPQQAAALSIAFQGKPPESVFVNGKANLTAVVSNDASNAGVTWKLVCQPNLDCGSLTPPRTESGRPVTYTPPASLSSNSQTFQILAFATADASKNLSTSITVSAFANILKGKYVLQSTGADIDPITGNLGPSEFAGVVILDGNGGISGGEQTYTNTSRSVSDQITGGNYFIGPDGRGNMTLNTADPGVGIAGIETFNIVVLSHSQAFILKNDPPNSANPSFESSTGTMELQTSVGPLSGGYAFAVNGTDVSSATPTGVGGVLNVDSPDTISGTGSIIDQDLPDFGITPSAPVSGAVTDPDAFGAINFNLSTPGFSQASMQFKGYMVDATHIKLVETDVDSVNLTGAATGGVAVGQGAATGTFLHKSAFAGNYAFGLFGQDASGLPSSLTSAGTFTAGPTATLKPGFNEVYFGGLDINVNDQFHAPACTLDITGTGRLDCLLTYKQALNGTGPEFIFYQTGNGNPALLLDADSNLQGGVGVATGFAYPLTSAASFNGPYAVRLTQNIFGSENDYSGEISVNGPAQALSGRLDTNNSFVSAGVSDATGSFVATPNPNILTGNFSNQFFSPFGVPTGIDYYLIDSGHGFMIETDLNDPINPSFAVSLGYFSARTPVCAGCP